VGRDASAPAIEAFLESRRTDLVQLACDLVATPSANPPGDERRVAGLVVERLRALGIEDVELHGPAPERPSLIARVPATGQKRSLLLSGHLDTKPPGDLGAWATPPWKPVIEDGMLRGLGAVDMKGAVAAMIYAAGALAHAGPPAGTLILALTADEEAGGVQGARWLAQQGLLAADACIIGEPCGLERGWEAIRLVSRGLAIFTIRVRGTQLHSGLSDRVPSVNASTKLAGLMTRLAGAGTDVLSYEPHRLVPRGPTFNVGLTVSSGVGYGILSGEAEFMSDVRALPGMTREGIEADLSRFLARERARDPELDVELHVDHWTPPCEIPAAHLVVGALSEAAEHVLGRRMPLDAFPGGTDAPHFQLGAGIPTVPAFGPGLLTAAHSPNEAVPVEEIVQAARIYALAALRFLDD
jgi:acetylornithine deacetylase/succinyl-diaminopimelate desuccinylase-like protein